MEPFIGQIIMFAGNFAPRGWAKCDGQLLPINQNAALFSILGTMYGGDGRTTFGLPDLRGRAPIHAGDGPGLSAREQGSQGGEESVALGLSDIPAHAHSVQVPGTSANANTDSPARAQLATASGGTGKKGGSGGSALYNQGGPTDAGMLPFKSGRSGSNRAHENMPPYQAVNFVIALQGIFPSRS